jgi:hypothetical protein
MPLASFAALPVLSRRVHEMSSEVEQRRLDLAWSLYCAWQTLDRYEGDQAGRDDIMHRIKRTGERYHEAGGSQAEFVEFCALRDLEVSRQREVAMERAYAKRGYL